MPDDLLDFDTQRVDLYSPESTHSPSDIPHESIIETPSGGTEDTKVVETEDQISNALQPETEQTERLFDIERSRKFGEFYKGVVHGILEGQDPNTSYIDNSEDKILAESMIDSVNSGLNEQAIKVELGNITAQDLLLQSFKDPDKIELLNDTSMYSIKEHAKGLYEIILDIKLYSKLVGKNGGQATAVRPPGGISYILVPRFNGNEEYNKRHLEENIPHETHHILWGFMQLKGVLDNIEANEEMSQAFNMYRDELVAKMVTGENIVGYDHLYNQPNKKARLTDENPELVEQIDQTVMDLNKLLYYEGIGISKTGPVRHEDMIFSVVSASNFQELKANIEKAKQYIQANSLPVEEPINTTGGWGAI